jgi:hypothetical protein
MVAIFVVLLILGLVVIDAALELRRRRREQGATPNVPTAPGGQ